LPQKTQSAQKHDYVFNLRIFASFAAENYSFSAPPRLCVSAVKTILLVVTGYDFEILKLPQAQRKY
jgi:hypothetical protein